MEGIEYRLCNLLRQGIELLGMDYTCFRTIQDKAQESRWSEISIHEKVIFEGIPHASLNTPNKTEHTNLLG